MTAARIRRLGITAEAKSQSAARWPPCVRIELRTKTPAQIAGEVQVL